MSNRHRTPTCILALAFCSVALQVGGLAAAANARLDPSERARVGAPPRVDLDAIQVRPTATTVPPAPSATPSTTTTLPPAPAPAPAPKPAAQTPAPTPPPRTESPEQRVRAAFEVAVPARWRSAIPVHLEIIDGSTSWAQSDGRIQIGTYHANGSQAKLLATLAHEFGHLVAFRFGTGSYSGAAPEGWPAYSSQPAEAWADCVSQAFTGVVDPSHGLPPCAGDSLSWTSRWLAQGPPAPA